MSQAPTFHDVPPVRPDFDKPNYDQNNIAPYTLEDPLTFLNGEKVKTPEDWQRRRQEILDIFAREMYGQEPPKPDHLIIDKWEEKTDALAGFAVRNQFKMYFKTDKSGPCINWMLIRPKHAKGPVPVIIYLNYNGNQEILFDKEVALMSSWIHNKKYAKDYRITEETRGRLCNPDSSAVMPIGSIIARGYAVLTASYADISPDPDPETEEFDQINFACTGVFQLWGKRDNSRTDNTTSLGAWAWGLSRGVDLIETIPELDAGKIIATGCSRLGKTAFLAAARDQRIALCVPNQCGGGGVTLAKRDYGENIATEMKAFKHWYCKAYDKYKTNPAKLLTFDQHLLVATIAPRALLVQGFNAPWFDTEGEFIACQAASPVWELLGKPGLPKVSFPDNYDLSAVGPCLGYARRTQDHGLADWDWNLTMDFADQVFKGRPMNR